MRTKVYVAGPISKGDLNENIQQARDACVSLIKAGYAPYFIHGTCFISSNAPSINGHPEIDHKAWLESDLPWVECCDCLLRLPGESKGADMEEARARECGIPIFNSVEEILREIHPEQLGDREYLSILREMSRLHCQKAADYGTEEDSFANIRGSVEIGIEPWRAAYLRAKDKVKRIDRFCKTGRLRNEGVEDSFKDNAAYNLIALRFFREFQRECLNQPSKPSTT